MIALRYFCGFSLQIFPYALSFLCLGGNDPGMDTNRKMHKEKSEEKIRRNNAMLS